MKKLLLLPILMFGSLAMAIDSKYEITPLVGYNITGSGIGLDNYKIYGLEAQYNGFDFPLKPELSFLYSKADYSDISVANNKEADTDVARLALNGVYEFNKFGFFTPLAKVGVGFESISNKGIINTIDSSKGNLNSPFIDFGIGAKVSLADRFSLKFEAVDMIKYNNARYDNNLALFVGLNISFGTKRKYLYSKTTVKKSKKLEYSHRKLDDDKDGVVNSIDECPNTSIGHLVNTKGCFVDNDDDKDGVSNSIDECPNTPSGIKKVDIHGCLSEVSLHIKFRNKSYNVDEQSSENIQEFVKFLKARPSYSATIIGHTDSRGKKKDNQKLSKNRAEAVKKIIIESGVSQSRVYAIGKGEDDPIAYNTTQEGRAKNRRIEVKLNKIK